MGLFIFKINVFPTILASVTRNFQRLKVYQMAFFVLLFGGTRIPKCFSACRHCSFYSQRENRIWLKAMTPTNLFNYLISRNLENILDNILLPERKWKKIYKIIFCI